MKKIAYIINNGTKPSAGCDLIALDLFLLEFHNMNFKKVVKLVKDKMQFKFFSEVQSTVIWSALFDFQYPHVFFAMHYFKHWIKCK